LFEQKHTNSGTHADFAPEAAKHQSATAATVLRILSIFHASARSFVVGLALAAPHYS